MANTWCPVPKDSSLRLMTSCLLAVTGGSVVFYVWRRRKETVIKQQVAIATAERKARVLTQKESVRIKSRNVDDNLRKRIVNLSSQDLLEAMAANRLPALQVLRAYQSQSCQVDLRTNCITEYLENAEELAVALDCKNERGPLHGLPISVKEIYNIKDMDCTAGVASLLNKPCSQDATLVAVLKQLGAVVFARTNIVQTTCSFGSSNPIYGATSSPHNAKRVPGGSSCGEGALISGWGSLVGLGTDLGGSVRIPAAMSGHFTLKPTQNRLSGNGIYSPVPGITGLHSCPGIMSREVQAIATVFQSLATPIMFNMDPKVIPLPFQEKVFNSKKPLTIGYYEDDGIVGPTPGCKRAVRVAKAVLEKMGHKDYLQLFIKAMKRQKIDVLLAPGYAIPACTPNFIQRIGGTVFITMLYNMLDFPAGIVPVTRETVDDQLELEHYPANTELHRNMKEATKGATGMPLGVQIVGFPWQEELVLRLMKELDHGIRTRCMPDEPLPPIMDSMV